MRFPALLAVAACNYSPPGTSADGGVDSSNVGDGSVDAPFGGPHLVISEIFAETGTDEFIEIHNPLPVAVPLGNVFLTDISDYWALPGGVPTGINSDFLAKFPDGSEIAAGAVIVVAIDGPTFEARFLVAPTYTIRTATAGAAAMKSILPPAAAVGVTSDEGEMLVLFEWDGARDLTRDLDIVVHGMPGVGNTLTAKQAVDGPDADADVSSYAVDTNLTMRMASRTSDGGNQSYQRVTLDEQETVGGNGITGHDETSEPLDTTFTTTSAANPGVLSF